MIHVQLTLIQAVRDFILLCAPHRDNHGFGFSWDRILCCQGTHSVDIGPNVFRKDVSARGLTGSLLYYGVNLGNGP